MNKSYDFDSNHFELFISKTFLALYPVKQGFILVYNWSANQRNCTTCWELEPENLMNFN